MQTRAGSDPQKPGPADDDDAPRKRSAVAEAARAHEDDSAPVIPEADREKADRVEEHTTPRTPVIYETVRRAGEEEMHRPALSLWWSGVAAGLSISFSLLVQALLHVQLPDAPWRGLVVALGYPFGFLMVVLGRQQLFTENTITVVLPVMARPSLSRFGRAGRLWVIVLAANLVGTFAAAAFATFTPVVSEQMRASMLLISHHALAYPPFEMFLRGIGAGYLMAAMVWLMPAAGGSTFAIVFVTTYVIGIGGFAHIVAGSLEAFLLALAGEMAPAALLGDFMIPALAGNVVGGTALFAMISYAQVMKEIEPDPRHR